MSSALNPLNGETVPVVLADYVIEGYGTGAVMECLHTTNATRKFAGMLGLPTSASSSTSTIPPDEKLGNLTACLLPRPG